MMAPYPRLYVRCGLQRRNKEHVDPPTSSQGQSTVCELVCRLIFRMTIMPTHPLQPDLAGEVLLVQQFPEFLVQYRRSGSRFPALPDPARKPFTQSLQGVLAIRAKSHFRPFGNPAQGLNGCRQFGNVVGAMFLDKAAMFRALPIRRLDHRPPGTGAGIGRAAGPITPTRLLAPGVRNDSPIHPCPDLPSSVRPAKDSRSASRSLVSYFPSPAGFSPARALSSD